MNLPAAPSHRSVDVEKSEQAASAAGSFYAVPISQPIRVIDTALVR
jgi:hypothetical protein